MNSIAITCALLLAAIPAYGQTGNWDLLTDSDRLLPDVLLHSMSEDTLYVYREGMTEGIALDRIAELRQGQGTYAWAGGTIGAIAGVYAGLEVDRDAASDIVLAGSVVVPVLGGALGGLLGAFAGGALSPDEVYDLRGMSHYQRRVSVEYLILHE